MTPELPLYLLTPSCRLYTAKEEPSLGDPWWAIFWPGGQVFFPSCFYKVSSISRCSPDLSSTSQQLLPRRRCSTLEADVVQSLLLLRGEKDLLSWLGENWFASTFVMIKMHSELKCNSIGVVRVMLLQMTLIRTVGLLLTSMLRCASRAWREWRCWRPIS